MGHYQVRSVRDAAELTRIIPAWEAIAGGVPFRGPTWLLTWWRHYREAIRAAGLKPQLFALTVEDDGRLVGLVPWYVEQTRGGGRVLRALGSGRVCSDYLTVLCASGNETGVAAAVVDFLVTKAYRAWDRLELDSAAVEDPALQALFAEFARRGTQIERRPAASCWRISLPDDWEAYLARLSKSHRKQVRRLATNVLDTPRAVWHTTVDEHEFERDWTIFVDLHQRRRYRLGDVGCFCDRTFAAFHEDVARQFLRRGELRLHRLEIDGRPIAAEYHLAGRDTVFAYQSGIEPTALDDEPGRLAAIAVIRQAPIEGFATYDLLRGDEPYKAHWRAVPLATEQVTIVAPRFISRLRHAALHGARRLKRALSFGRRRGTNVAAEPTTLQPQVPASPFAEPAAV